MPTDTLPRRSVLWSQLKQANVTLPKAYINYTEAELEALVLDHIGETFDHKKAPADQPRNIEVDLAAPVTEHAPPPPPLEVPTFAPEAPSLDGMVRPDAPVPAPAPQGETLVPGTAAWLRDPKNRAQWSRYAPETLAKVLGVPFKDLGAERAGLTMNTHGVNDPIRVDSRGRIWYTDLVQKPSVPKARMVRKIEQVTNNVEPLATFNPDGSLNEIFEIAGNESHKMTVSITMPASQVGIYYDPRYPFKIHEYGGLRGFDYAEVRDYYGGLDLIPTSIHTVYIDGDMCYDINQTRDAIERELRERTLGRSAYDVR